MILENGPSGVSPLAVVYRGVTIEDNVTIMPGAVIGRPPMAAGTVTHQPDARTDTLIRSGSVIGCNAVIYQGVQIGRNVLIGDGATLRENCIIGEGSIVGNNCTFQNNVTMGKRSRVIDLSHITAFVDIGDDVFISTGVLTMNDNSMNRGGDLEPPRIANGAMVGGGAMLLPGVQVGEEAFVAAGAVATKDVPPKIRVMGIPARPQRGKAESGWDNPDQMWADYYFGEKKT